MQRFNQKVFGNMVPDKAGVYVMHSDVLKMMQGAVKYVVDHREDIQNGVNDYGELKPLLEMVIGKGNS